VDQPVCGHRLFQAPLQLPGVFTLPGKSPLGTWAPSAEAPFSFAVDARATLSRIYWCKPGLGEEGDV